MNKTVLIFVVTFFSFVSCNQSTNYKPEGLRKLSNSELIDHARAGNLTTENTIFKDSLGNIISRDDLLKMNQEEFFGDQFVNSNNEIVEVVIRKATNLDKALIEKIKEAFEEDEPVTIIEIDCSKIQEILAAVHETDQGNRQGGSLGNPEIDKENQQKVVSIIEKCGFPTVVNHGYKSIETVFLVLQHAGKGLREKYFPQIKNSADQGGLPWSIVALMEDRMLMDKGEKQKYGSQVKKDNGSEEWTLYPIQDPENVNEIREEVGLGPIEEYLLHFCIEYKIVK